MAQEAVRPDPANAVLDRLARLEPTDDPIVSLYLNLQANQHGKDDYQAFLRKELPARVRSFAEGSPQRAAVERDAQRITDYLASVPPSANGLAIFASDSRGLFEALTLDAPIAEHALAVGASPHLLPLELMLDRHPRYAVVLADSHDARILVYGQGQRVAAATVPGEPIRRSSGGGWAQMRYQRRVEQLQADHAREIVQVLDRLVRDERIDYLLISGDDVNLPLVRKALTPELAAKVVDELRLPAQAPEHDILRVASEAMRRYDARTDEEVVRDALDAYRAGGLGIAGLQATVEALERGQVHELYLTIAPEFAAQGQRFSADDLIARARQTSARVRFIEDVTLLADVDGVAASLRFRLRDARAEAGTTEGVAGS